jgi:penicillin-binding protein 2
MTCTVALRGRVPRLHFLKEIRENGKVIKKHEPSFKEVQIQQKNFDILIEGLFKVVENGTAKTSRVNKLDICGKTGTAQIITKENPDYEKLVKQDRFRPHSWFVSFAPRENPRIAMVVFVENGGDGSKIAAPLSAKIYRKIFKQ